MNLFRDLEKRIRRGEPIPGPVAGVLQAASLVQRAGMWWRLRQPRERVDARVISFGNITAGGSGKTPAVIERANAEAAAGKRVAVLTRGYGTASGAAPVLMAPGSYAPGVAARIGDEPALILRNAPQAFLVKCADRVAAARLAIAEAQCDTLILDDGYQTVRLERDENVLVMDATNPFGNGYLVPRGILREPVEAARRATHVVLTRCDQAPNIAPLIEQIRAWLPGTPIRKTRHAPARLWRVCDGQSEPLEVLRGAPVAIVCGIGNPEAFARTVESLGARIERSVALANHAPISAADIPAADRVIVTEKDAVRLNDAPPNVFALGIDIEDFA